MTNSGSPQISTLSICCFVLFPEILFGILLLLGWQTRIIALLSGGSLLLFAVTMTGALDTAEDDDARSYFWRDKRGRGWSCAKQTLG